MTATLRIIRVLLVDDSPLALVQLKRMLAAAADIVVAGTARNGREALELIPRLAPDVVCTDLHMPVMDGLQLTREIMARFPRPILVVSISASEGATNVFTLLEAGALDIFTKSKGGSHDDFERRAPELARKIRILAGVHVFRKHPLQAHQLSAAVLPGMGNAPPVRMVVIGASTGGPQALQTILTRLPADYPFPIVCVQHISEGFLTGFTEWLASQCSMKVTIALPGEHPMPGTIYFPMEGTHLKFDECGGFVASTEPPCNGHRPSINVTMQGAARAFGAGVLGILLTGMGRDGVEGMQAVVRAGGITIAQDEETSVVFGMPKEAVEAGAARYVIALENMADALMEIEGQYHGRRESEVKGDGDG